MKASVVGRPAILSIMWLLAAMTHRQGPMNEFPTGNSSGKRAVTVADAVRMTRQADTSQGRALAHYSPDGKRFVVVLRKGNLEDNTNDFSLLLWRTDEAFYSSRPEALVTLSSSSNRDGIEDVRWLPDNETITFLGENPRESHQVFALDIRTHRLQKLTRHPTNVISYSTDFKGSKIAYVAEAPTKGIFDAKTQQEGFVVSTQLLADLLAGKNIKTPYGFDQQLFFQEGRDPGRLLRLDGQIPAPGDGVPLLSPDGRYIAIPAQVAEIPESWKEYSNPRLHELAARKLAVGQYSWLTRYTLIDTTSDENQILLDSPLNWNTEITWSPDSRSVAFVNAYLPFNNVDGEEREVRKSKAFAVEVKVPDRQIAKISGDDLEILRWDAKTNLLICKTGKLTMKSDTAPEMFFRKIGEKWQRLKDAVPDLNQPEIVSEEDMNSPPRIFAVAPNGSRRSLLLDLNPQFKELNFAKVEEIEWKSTDGHKVKGGLYYPLNYTPGKKYPLVIQTHEWYANRFMIDGPYSTAFAAQPLAGKEIMVLQAEQFEEKDNQWWYKETDTPKEIGRYVSAYEGAIDYLDAKEFINRYRVGIVGFSRTCLYVKYALTHSKYHFAAASVTDGIDGGYFRYIAESASPNVSMEFEGFNGGLPFGEGLKSWVERSPGFNVDKVQTPLRITAENPAVALVEWEWYATLRRLGKPVEMVMLRDGSHELTRPWDRMVSLQGNVDWFAFWLKGEEDPGPTKAGQYARWRELRKLQEQNARQYQQPNLPSVH
jgi:dipeptidyl aminopeptidase/acylaminoacyl peptidase